MSNKLDVDDLINWLNQSEDEAKATVAESGATADPFYDGVLSAIFQIREYIKKMRKIDDAEGKSDREQLEYLKWWQEQKQRKRKKKNVFSKILRREKKNGRKNF